MADRIKVLPESVANQIAAGEVVNRPSSVIKEMLENSVDAGSKNITVHFKDGGKSLIQIIDDGCGMSHTDARMAFDRHATSKIRDVEDIYSLSTFGFRGEALASIASVAEVELRSRQHDQELGTKVEISGGKFVDQTPVSCPPGTQFLIRNLFYNIPARRRFLEKSTTESRHIIAEFNRVAMCNPEIGFSLYDNDTLISKLPPSALRQRIGGITGKHISKNLLDVNTDTSLVKIEGFTGRPESAKQSSREQYLFVNGRYFKSPYFHKAVISAYEKLIQPNTQPPYFLFLTVDPEKIDVNVHPQKTEVKFSEGTEIWHVINAAIRETLAKSGAVPPMDFEMDPNVEIPVFREGIQYKSPSITANPQFNPFEKYPETSENYTDSPAKDTNNFPRPSSSNNFTRGVQSGINRFIDSGSEFEDGLTTGNYEESILEFIEGDNERQQEIEFRVTNAAVKHLNFGKRYTVIAEEGGLKIIDMARAYESILFDRYMVMLGNGSSLCQQLLFPENLILSTDDCSLLKENIDEFTAFGFDILIVDQNTVTIKGMPADFSDEPCEKMIYELLDLLRDGNETSEHKRRKISEAMSSLGSVKRIMKLSPEETVEIIDQLSSCSNPSFTPSGNLVMTIITEEEVKKRLTKK